MAPRGEARTRAVEAATRLFDRQGYHGTGLAELLAASGSPRGSFYFHFPGGKEQLGVEAVERAADEVRALFAHAERRAQGDPAATIRRIGAALGDWLERTDFTAGCAVSAVAVETAAGSEALREACRAAYASWRERLAARLEEAGHAEADARAWAGVVVAALEGATIIARTERSSEPVRSAAERLAEALGRPRPGL